MESSSQQKRLEPEENSLDFEAETNKEEKEGEGEVEVVASQ